MISISAGLLNPANLSGAVAAKAKLGREEQKYLAASRNNTLSNEK